MLKCVTAKVDEEGARAKCPICGKENVAVWGEDGKLVWWPNNEKGKWCEHCRGCYHVSIKEVQFFFE